LLATKVFLQYGLRHILVRAFTVKDRSFGSSHISESSEAFSGLGMTDPSSQKLIVVRVTFSWRSSRRLVMPRFRMLSESSAPNCVWW
jgi:hypothetical protein